MVEHKVIIYQESLLGNILSFFTGGLVAGAKTNPIEFTKLLNSHAKEGWEVVAMDRESRRALLIFKREAFVIILKRNKS
ncbi:MAG: hypothetical protein ACJAW3_000087 [Lentimonas sp.]|jgi:hypothetical protein